MFKFLNNAFLGIVKATKTELATSGIDDVRFMTAIIPRKLLSTKPRCNKYSGNSEREQSGVIAEI